MSLASGARAARQISPNVFPAAPVVRCSSSLLRRTVVVRTRALTNRPRQPWQIGRRPFLSSFDSPLDSADLAAKHWLLSKCRAAGELKTESDFLDSSPLSTPGDGSIIRQSKDQDRVDQES